MSPLLCVSKFVKIWITGEINHWGRSTKEGNRVSGWWIKLSLEHFFRNEASTIVPIFCNELEDFVINWLISRIVSAYEPLLGGLSRVNQSLTRCGHLSRMSSSSSRQRMSSTDRFANSRAMLVRSEESFKISRITCNIGVIPLPPALSIKN